jgi:hypothetical protein
MAARKTTKKTVKSETVANDTFSPDAFSATAREQYDAFVARMTETAETMRAESEEIMTTVRDNFETVQAKMQTVSADLAVAAREEAAEAVEFVNELSRAKSIADAMEIQRGYYTKLFEERVARARELTDVSVEAARASLAPFGKTFSLEKFMPFGAK